MLRRLVEPEGDAAVRLMIAGQPVIALRGESVAAAALASGLKATRNAPTSGDPRAPYCLMGVCFECLMTIDGQPNREACLVPVQDGMIVEPQMLRPSLGVSDDA
tara:strand:+ start:148 stop:459 length:312 start_codon:yes stop_codon:yes gene_type:complete